MFKRITFFFCFFIFFLNSKAQTVDEIISNYITFLGGEEKLRSIKTIITSGKYNYGGMEFPFTSYSKAPNLYKYVVTNNGKHFAQAYDGKEGWKIDQFKNETNKTILHGDSAYRMANEADVELENPFINYKSKGYSITLEGKDTVSGALCFKVRLIKNNTDTATYFFETDNFELLKKQAISKNDELDNSLLDTFYSDYKVVDGIKIPFKTISKANDQMILTITIEKVQFNVPIPDNEFAL